MESKNHISATYLSLLDQIRTLLNRDNLVNNSYLFKFIKSNLVLPLYALVQQRKISQITNDQQQIISALEETGLARVQKGREVLIIDYPTIKISTKVQQIFKQIEAVLKQHEKRYAFSERSQKEYINLTIYEQDPSFLQQLVPSLSKQIDFQKVSLYQDMKLGVARVKKIKAQQKNSPNFNSKNGTGKNKYSLERPPQVFIRRAVESSQQEEVISPTKTKQKQKYGNRKKYRQAPKQKVPVKKPTFSQQDFPSLP